MAIIKTNDNGTTEELYKGLIVGTSFSSGGWMDHYYAVIYHKETDSVEKVCYKFEDRECWNASWCLGECVVDADTATMAEYKAHVLREERHAKAVELAEKIKRRHFECEKMRVSIKEYNELANAIPSVQFEWVYNLLKTKNFRNEFRKKLDAQVRDWLKEESHKYRTPLSPRQMDCLRPYKPW